MSASNTPNSPGSDWTDIQTVFNVVARMTFHSKTQHPAAKGKKSKTVTTKETRAKEFQFTFAPTQDNYVLFLQTILEKQYVLQYTVSDQCIFPCTVQVPPSKYVPFLSCHTLTRCTHCSSLKQIGCLLCRQLHRIRDPCQQDTQEASLKAYHGFYSQ
jgi:hypothetical protein